MKKMIDKAIRYKGLSFHYMENADLNGEKDIHTGVEVVWLIKGSATFMTEKHCEDVSDGTLIIIPSRTFHQFKCEKKDYFTFITINVREYNDERNYLLQGMGEAFVFTDGNSPYIDIIKKIEKVLREKEDSLDVKTWLYCTCMAMFAQMRFSGDYFGQENLSGSHSPLIADVLAYIEANLLSDITVNDIADNMCVSASTLFHSFKKEMGISVYKYLVQKRLILAAKLIDEGERPTEIYYKCGFKDYPNFFRAYRNMFGITPAGKVSNRKVPPKPIKPAKR